MDLAEAERLAHGPAGQLWLSLAPNDEDGYEAATEDGRVHVLLHPGGVRLDGPDGVREFGNSVQLTEVLRALAEMVGAP